MNKVGIKEIKILEGGDVEVTLFIPKEATTRFTPFYPQFFYSPEHQAGLFKLLSYEFENQITEAREKARE